MAAGDGRTMQYHLNRLAGTLDSSNVPRYASQGAANIWAGTSGLALQGALNRKAGTSGLAVQGALNKLAGTSGLGENEAAARITA